MEDTIMKRIFIYAMAVLALMIVSCEKEINVVEPENNTQVLVPMTFETKAVETKTTLGDANAVLWKTGDALNVIEVNGEGNIVGQRTFTLTAGNGLATASFSGEVADPANTFYAVYPDIKLYNKNDGDALGSTIELATDTSSHDYDAIKDSYDPKGAIMTAVVEGGKLTFRHAVAYLKFTANSSDITSVKIQNAGGARLWGRPVITLSTGAPSSVNGTGSDKTYVVVRGTFVSGGTYVVPVTIKNSSLGNVTVTATNTAGTESEITTTAIAGQTLAAGKIYDLRTPPFNFSPVIVPVAPAKLEADATSGSFTYTVSKPDGVSTVSAVKKSGDWITAVDDSEDGTISFSCTANTGAERTGVITLSYTGAADVDVTITQKASGGGASEDYVWDFSDDSWIAFFETAGSKDANIEPWNFVREDLTLVSQKSKWNYTSSNVYYIQFGGTSGVSGGVPTKYYFKFTTSSAGTLTVTASGTNTTSRKVYVMDDGDEQYAANACTSTTAQDYVFDVDPGDIYVYAKDGALRFYKIEFHSN